MQPIFRLDYSLACLKDKDYALSVYHGTGMCDFSVYIQSTSASGIKTFLQAQDFPLPVQGIQEMFGPVEPDIILNVDALPVFWRKDLFDKQSGGRFNHQLKKSFSMEDFIPVDIADVRRNFLMDELVTQRKNERMQVEAMSGKPEPLEDALTANTNFGQNWYISL